MKKITIHQVDAFTHKLFGGNPAAVVFEADSLSIQEIHNIAREMNLSETAFVLKPTQKNANFKLRYFTPAKAEIKFCGHATMGTLYEVGRLGLFGTKEPGHYKLNIETNAGILPMEIIKKSENDIAVKFTAPKVQLENYSSQHAEFAKRLGIPLSAIDTRYPIMIERHINDIHLKIKSLKLLGNLEFNFQHIIDNFKKEEIVAFCLLTTETFEKENNVHVRGLAPIVGVPEDPFTGRLQGPLAAYLLTNKIIHSNTKSIGIEQGHFIDRPGFSIIDLPSDTNASSVITSRAVHVFSTEINL